MIQFLCYSVKFDSLIASSIKPTQALLGRKGICVLIHTLLLLFRFSVMSNSVTPWTAARPASLPFTISWRLLKLMSIESMISSNHLILCHPLLLLPSIFPSIRVSSSELALHIRWPKQRSQVLGFRAWLDRGYCLFGHLLELSVPAGFLFGFFKINKMIICGNPYISHL